MRRIWITKRTRIRKLGKGSLFSEFSYDLPDCWVDWPSADELARELGASIAEKIRANCRSGRDALGERLSLKQITEDRRVYNRQPPRRSNTRRLTIRTSKSGKERLVASGAKGDWYSQRFPGGPSLGGVTALTDSGHLANDLRVSVVTGGEQRAQARVLVPKARIVAVLAIEKGFGRSRTTGKTWSTFGGTPHPIFAVRQRDLDEIDGVATRAVSGARSDGGSGLGIGNAVSGLLGKGIGTLGVLGLFAAARGLAGGA
jgi:hypothetical protein